MPNITCSAPDCGAILMDPCVPTHAFFKLKAELLERQQFTFREKTARDLVNIDKELTDKYGLVDPESHFERFKSGISTDFSQSYQVLG